MDRPLASPRPTARRPRPARGAALLVVIVAVAVVSAIAVDLAYSTRVSLLTAANARDELRAEYLARSGVQLSRLVLNFQKKLDGVTAAGAKAGIPRVQIWQLVPIADGFTDALFGAAREGTGPAGKFEAKLEDEGRKVIAQMDGIGAQGSAQIAALLQLVGDPKWDPLFDREDANGLRVTRPDVAVYLHDWTDEDSVGSAISMAGTFEPGFGDENAPYRRGDDPYQAKNARFDSLDELYLLAGIDDDFMAAFGRQLTVYPDVNGRRNVNTLDPDELLLNARIMADPPQQAKLADPAFPSDLARAVSRLTLGGILTMSPFQFAQIVQSLGILVNGVYQSEASAANGAFVDSSLVYRIRATGGAGATERRVDAVVTFDPRQVKQEPADAGRLLHWREE
jgi:general secretion pathway protein K